MSDRGEMYYAVMAVRANWKNPCFVWAHGYGYHLYIYPTLKRAKTQLAAMQADKNLVFAANGREDRYVEVSWVIRKVWIETMPEAL